MKTFKQTTLFLFIMTFCLGAFAQIKVTEKKNNFAGKMVNALFVEIPEAEEKEVMKEFKILMKDYKGEVNKKKKQYFSINTIIQEISNDPITVYFSVEAKAGGGSILETGFKLSGGFISSATTPVQYKSASKIIRDFAVKSTKAAISKSLETALKAKDNLSKQHIRLKKENEKLNKSIVVNKDKILRAEAEIKEAESTLTTNNEEQKKKEAELAAHQKVLEEIQKKLGRIK